MHGSSEHLTATSGPLIGSPSSASHTSHLAHHTRTQVPHSRPTEHSNPIQPIQSCERCPSSFGSYGSSSSSWSHCSHWSWLVVLLVLVHMTPVDSLRFHVSPNRKKCLHEQIQKDLLVTGDYELSDAPGQKTLLLVCWPLFFGWKLMGALLLYSYHLIVMFCG